MNRDGFGRLGARAVAVAGAGLVALALVVFGLANLKSHAKSTAPSGKPFRVVTTFTVIQDIAQNVAGDKAIVESITKPGAEIHDYQPTPLDIVKAQAADLVLWNGFNLERWFEKFFENVKERAERRRDRRHRADGHHRGALYRQAQSARLDVADQCADLCREHPQGAGQVRSGECRRLQQECRGLFGADQGARRAAAQAARGDPGEPALAGHRAKAPSAI